MPFRKLAVVGLAVAALMLPSIAVAQDNTAPPAAPASPAAPATPAATDAQTVANADNSAAAHDPKENWLKVCDPIGDGKKACIMRQVVLANGQFLGSFLLRDDPGQESRLLAVAAVPLGVLLPFGLTWQIDSGKPIRVPFMLCDPTSCATQLVINEAYVASLKKGGTLKLTAKNRQNKDLVISIDLSGFTSVYDGDAAMTFEQFNNQNAGPTALEKSIQDRADAIRQQLQTTDGTSTDGSPPAAPAPAPASP
jgi:invasion protein IalB